MSPAPAPRKIKKAPLGRRGLVAAASPKWSHALEVGGRRSAISAATGSRRGHAELTLNESGLPRSFPATMAGGIRAYHGAPAS